MKRSRLDDMIMKLEGIDNLGRREIEELQFRKLNELLHREHERGGFYSGLPRKLDSLEELSALPFTTAEDLQQHSGRMLLCSQNEVQRVITDRTSGTTGHPKRLFYTREDLEHTVLLFMAGLGEFIYRGSKTMICMPFSGPYGLGELIAEAVERLGAEALRIGPFLTYSEYEEVIRREQPDTFVGMPVQLLSILRFCKKGSLQRALVSGDACPETVMAQCESLLGTKLFPHYGSREMALGGAVTCPAHRGMHLRENHVIAEIIDERGKVLPDGQYGELVITTIGMAAQPLIRYRTGDFTRILADPCPCGSKVIRLDQVRRKEEDEIPVIEDLDNILFGFPEVVDYYAGYEPSGLHLELLIRKECQEEVICQMVREKYRDLNVTINARQCTGEFRSLYKAKRSVERPITSEEMV
ncbi:MAG: AMP-binding protein [Eubacteriales bacterium]|nr:AMP-binding protein [Eubacteriales bacterium]